MSRGNGPRSAAIFSVGFVLGLLFGAGSMAAVMLLVGGSEPEVADALPPATVEEPEPVVAAAPVVAAVPVEPEPASAPVAPTPAVAKPKAAPAPVPLPPKPAASLSQGPSEVVFVGSDGERHSPDAVPPGKFDVHANWGSGLVKSGSITVKEGKPLKLVCDPPTQTCKEK